MNVLLLLLLLAAPGPLVAKERSRLSLESDGGYTDLVIAIDRSLPEDPQLVEKVKSTLGEFSKQLSVATKPMFSNGASLHVARAFILVPKTWTNRTAVDANSTWQTFENSDIRLGRSPHQPHYTYHSGGCGSPGDYTVFDTGHVNGTDGFWLGKQMLSEFGQLRWGLRSEHNGQNGQHYYLEGGRIVPAICTRGINGSFRHNVTNEHCKVNLNTTEMEPNCKFYPEQQQTVAASVLGTTAARGIEHFCDHWDSDPAELRHNKRAPVPLNKVCINAGSARDIMRKSISGDFLRPPTLNAILPPVQFTVVRPLPDRRLVLIIDISGSMDGDPMNKIKTGVDNFLRDLVEDGIECALVAFNESAHLVKPLNFLNSMQVREEYAKAVIALKAVGYTAIGDALALGMQILGVDPAAPNRNVPGYMLLLTDGGENRALNYTLLQATSVLVNNTSIIVDTVAFGTQADKRLTQLSEGTNGMSFFCRFENSTNDFIEQLSETVRKRVESAAMPIEVFSAPIEATFDIPVNIDKSIGKDTSFMLSTYRASDISNMDLKVTSPNGGVYDRNSPQYHKDTTLGTVTIRISGRAEEGEWRASDGRSARLQPSWSSAQVFNTRSALTVTSKPASEEEPVVLDGSVSADANINLNRSTSITIVASMFRGFERIRGATILAKIESESSTNAVLTLQDNGVFPDHEADDGIHSAQVPLKSVSTVQEYNVRLISDSPVSRVTSAGKFYVKSVDLSSLQNLPPNPVKDLKVSADLPSKTLRLWWTAVGDEQNQGTAARCILKSSDNDTLIEEDFYSADNVSVTVTPLQAGSTQSVSISSDQLAGYNNTFYLAVKTVSAKGVDSGLSNLVAIQLKLPDNIDSIDGTITSTTQESSTSQTSQAPEILSTTSGSCGSLQGSGVTRLLLGFSLIAVGVLSNLLRFWDLRL